MIEISPAEARKQPGESLAVLRRELSRLAMRNRRFQSGELDFQEVNLWHGDRSTPTFRGVAPVLQQGFRFCATRFRSTVMRPFLEYEYSHTARFSNSSLPDHIAVDQYGLSPEESVLEAGQVTMERSVLFKYNTLVGRLAVCEAVEYFDEDYVSINHACTCPLASELNTDVHTQVYCGDAGRDDEERVDLNDIEDEIWADDGEVDVAELQFYPTASRLREFIEDDKERERAAHTPFSAIIDRDEKRRMVRMAIVTARSIHQELDQL